MNFRFENKPFKELKKSVNLLIVFYALAPKQSKLRRKNQNHHLIIKYYMKRIILCIGFISIYTHLLSRENKFDYKVESIDSLPTILTENRGDLVAIKLRNEAVFRFAEHQLPTTKEE